MKYFIATLLTLSALALIPSGIPNQKIAVCSGDSTDIQTIAQIANKTHRLPGNPETQPLNVHYVANTTCY